MRRLFVFVIFLFSAPVADSSKSSIKFKSSTNSPLAFLVEPVPNISVTILKGVSSPNLVFNSLFFLSNRSKGSEIFFAKSFRVLSIPLNSSSGNIALKVDLFSSKNFPIIFT